VAWNHVSWQMTRLGHIRFDWQISLIGLSALVGLLIAYNQQMAALQFVIVAISIAVYLIGVNIPDPIAIGGRPRSVLAAMVTLLPAVIAVIFVVTNNWAHWIGKVPAFDPILRVLAGWLPGAASPVNPNVIGGALAALLPLQVFALRRARRVISVPLIALTLIALVLSQTRGAWLSLILVLGMWMLWRVVTKRVMDESRARRLWLASMIGCGVIVIGILVVTPMGDRLLGLGGDRRAIWSNSVDLIGDYPLTGLGLAGFEMAYSTYTMLIHVGHTLHAHNLWLDMWLNQGLIGTVALAGMIINATWHRSSSTWRIPSLLALGVALLYGLVDDPYYGPGLLVVFIPLGLLIRSDSSIPMDASIHRPKFQPALTVWIATIGILVVGLLTPLGRATLEANLGTLSQTYVELSRYRWPDVPIQDALRRSGAADLSSAIAHYTAALYIDPTNATANRRLGQIELAREQFEAACTHLGAAYQAAPYQRATRQLLGECDAFTGEVAKAVELWKTIDVSQSQLNIRQWWYDEYLQDDAHAAQFQAAVNALSRE
jgi:O-antigen ligase